MGLTNTDWAEIQRYVERRLAENGEYFSQGLVIKRDATNKLIWLKEFGDIAIPLYTFDVVVKYYVTESDGSRTPKYTKAKEVEIQTPEIGDVVLIAKLLGSNHLPRCIGVLKSTNLTGGE